MSQETDAKNNSKGLSQSEILSIITTEHYNLQGARSATVSEATGRANLYLSSISGTLVALGIITQTIKTGDAFYLFSLVLLPSLLFVGIVTFVRILETTIEDINYGRGINRLRHYYLELLPEMRNYFILSDNDDVSGVLRNMGIYKPSNQTFISTNGMISVLNSVIAGSISGIVVSGVFSAPTIVCGGIGIVIFVIVVILHQIYMRRKLTESNGFVTPVFPTKSHTSE